MDAMLYWPFGTPPCSPLNAVLLMSPLVVMVAHLMLTFVWFWWQVQGVSHYHPIPTSFRHYLYFCLDQHVFMLCLHLCMHAYLHLGGWFSLWSLIVHDDHFVLRQGHLLSRHFSSSMLSLTLACKLAQGHVSLWTCCCWQLDYVPQVRDEVKEQCLFIRMISFVFFDNIVCIAGYKYPGHVIGQFIRMISLVLLLFWLFYAESGCCTTGFQQTNYAFGFSTKLNFSARRQAVVMPVTLTVFQVWLLAHALILCWIIQNISCWQRLVFFDNSACIKGYTNPGHLVHHSVCTRSMKGALQYFDSS